jgi:hypothetical protein
MSSMSVVLDRDSIGERRDELLQRAGMSLSQLRERQAAYELDQNQQAILRRLEELEFLEGR